MFCANKNPSARHTHAHMDTCSGSRTYKMAAANEEKKTVHTLWCARKNIFRLFAAQAFPFRLTQFDDEVNFMRCT